MSKFFKKYFIAIAFGIAVAGLFAASSFQAMDEKSNDQLVVGLQSGYPPFEFMNHEGKLIGFDIDLAGRLAEELGKTLVIKDMDFDGEILSLKQGKIDLIMSGMDITPGRLKEIAMIPYHGEAADSLSLIFWNEIPEGIHALADVAKLPNPAVSVESGATPETVLKKFPDIQTKAFQGAMNPLMDVKYGKSAANLVEPAVAGYLKQKHPEIKILNIPLPKEVAVLGFGIGIKKDNQTLFNEVQQIIKELKASGELTQLENKWFKGEE